MSLLPSATEIVGGLGLEGHLVGVSHECDVAPTAERLRAVLEAGCERVTTSDIDPHALPQGEIDRRVKAAQGGRRRRAVRRRRGGGRARCSYRAPDADVVWGLRAGDERRRGGPPLHLM